MSKTIAVTAAAGVLVAAAAFFGGRELRGETEGPVNAFDTDAPSYTQGPDVIAESVAGFTGAGALPGRPVFSGEIVAVDGNLVTIATPSGDLTVEVEGDDKLWLLAGYDGGIEVGDNVVLRQEGDTAVALLLLDR